MRIFQTLFLFVGLSCFLLTDQADAQLIRITPNGYGGVNIRAPFVRVHTDPYGPTHVRAPFVDVNAPPSWYQPHPYYVQPYYNGGYAPTYGAPVYGVPNTGATIVEPPDLVGSPDVAPSYQPGRYTIESNGDPAPGGQPINAAERELPHNTHPTLPGMKSVLDQSVDQENDIQVFRRDLMTSSIALNQSLARYSNALVWQEYLALPQYIQDDSNWMDVTAIDQDQMNQVTKTLSRFEKTNNNAEMQLIYNLEEFRRMHRELSNFVQILQNQSHQDTAELPPPPIQDVDR